MNSIEIIYEDNFVLVAVKPPGMASQSDQEGVPGVVERLMAQQSIDYLALIHRLDRPVGGLMLLAKTKRAAALLSKQFQNHEVKKVYQAVVWNGGLPESNKLVNYLCHEERSNRTRVVTRETPHAKKAVLMYRNLGEALLPIETYGLEVSSELHTLTHVEVELQTGRTHQIRVQFSEIGHPIFGERRYISKMPIDRVGSYEKPEYLALYASRVSFAHPKSRKIMTFSSSPTHDAFSLFSKAEVEGKSCDKI